MWPYLCSCIDMHFIKLGNYRSYNKDVMLISELFVLKKSRLHHFTTNQTANSDDLYSLQSQRVGGGGLAYPRTLSPIPPRFSYTFSKVLLKSSVISGSCATR